MSETMRREIEQRIRDRDYQWRAYMSSALTNPSDEDRNRLTDSLESLFLEVFDPLGVFLYLPHMWSSPADHNTAMSPEDVHILDRLRIAESDFLVVCADYPSFGVGQEFEIAQAMGLPLLVYRGEQHRVSRMLLGGAGIDLPPGKYREPSAGVVTYRDFAHLCELLRVRTVELINGKLAKQRESLRGDVVFGPKVQRICREKNIGVERLAERTGLSEPFVRFLLSAEADVYGVLTNWKLPRFRGAELRPAKYVNPGLWVLHRLARALEVRVADLFEGRVDSEEAQGHAFKEQLKASLARFLMREAKADRLDQLAGRIDGWTPEQMLAARFLDGPQLDAEFRRLLTAAEEK